MDIHVDELRVSDLFGKNNLVFEVPLYQRRYDWGVDQWRDLWDDVTEQESNGEHFLGSIVVVNEPAKSKGFDVLEVVDGQQRLATLSAFFLAVRDIYKARLDENKSKFVDDTYLHGQTIDKRSRKMILGRLDDKPYERLLRNAEKDDHQIVHAYNYFRKRLEEYQDIGSIAGLFSDHIKVVIISASNPEDAFKLFETLNDRGLDLSALDLIKNYILSETAKKSPEDFNTVVEFWDGIVQNLEEIDKLRFLRQFLLAKFRGKVTKSRLYPAYKEHITSDGNVADFVLDLHQAAEYYQRIQKKNFTHDGFNHKLEDLHNLKATTSFTLLLRLLFNNWSFEQMLKVIPAIECFSLRRSICGWSTNEMDTIYNQLATLQDTPLTIDHIEKVLSENTPGDNEFYEKFLASNYRQDTQTKYILEQFEADLVKTKEKRIADRQAVHIEHIMPQAITTKKCAKRHGGDWKKYLGEEANLHGEYYRRIGNLTLLASELNVPASNNPFEAKKEFYGKSEIQLTRALLQYQHWGIEQIKERSEHLAKRALDIWKI